MAALFFMQIVLADCEKIAVENPVGIMSTLYRKPDQIIQPYQFGEPVSKKTCLWLKGLPLLHSTNVVPYEKIHSKGKAVSWRDPRTAKERSKTYPGIAAAMAEQWG